MSCTCFRRPSARTASRLFRTCLVPSMRAANAQGSQFGPSRCVYLPHGATPIGLQSAECGTMLNVAAAPPSAAAAARRPRGAPTGRHARRRGASELGGFSVALSSWLPVRPGNQRVRLPRRVPRGARAPHVRKAGPAGRVGRVGQAGRGRGRGRPRRLRRDSRRVIRL
jgi:hypothetical protein